MPNAGMVYEAELEGPPLDEFAFYAFLFVYNEADIIESTIKNAYSQGCEKIFFVDHQSDDNTVEIAIKNGAVLYDKYRSRYFEEDKKVIYSNKCMEEISITSNSDHVWWLFIDADEFPHGPFGKTIREY